LVERRLRAWEDAGSVRLGLDLTWLRPDRLSGAERYALELVPALARLAPGEVVLFVRPDLPRALATLDVERRVASGLAPVALDQGWLPLAALRARVDLLHTLASPTPILWRGIAAMTVHDATPWLHPDAAGTRWYTRPLYPQALARAAAIFTVSEAAREDLVRAAGAPRERIFVTPNGVDPRFFDLRAPEGPRAPYLLAVGTFEPRKNLPILLDAFRILRRGGRDLQLVVAGHQAFTQLLPLGELAPHVRLTGMVSDDELRGLYAGAACFVMPSLHEGFGLPLAEAMAAGVPAVASDIPALREVGGEAVRYADPTDPQGFAAAVGAALDDREGSQLRAAAGRGRARRFRWEETARATLAVYRRVLRAAGRS
jgi:glycosyltransferase involved in cell wall biosynthesis